MPTKIKRKKARLQLVMSPKLDQLVRDLAHRHREYPSTTGARLLAQALGRDPSEFGINGPKRSA